MILARRLQSTCSGGCHCETTRPLFRSTVIATLVVALAIISLACDQSPGDDRNNGNGPVLPDDGGQQQQDGETTVTDYCNPDGNWEESKGEECDPLAFGDIPGACCSFACEKPDAFLNLSCKIADNCQVGPADCVLTSTDGCCPAGCNSENDADCDDPPPAPSCGDRVKNGNEKCDINAPAGSDDVCPTVESCAPADNCKVVDIVLAAGTCQAECGPVLMRNPNNQRTDGCCPTEANGTVANDVDCCNAAAASATADQCCPANATPANDADCCAAASPSSTSDLCCPATGTIVNDADCCAAANPSETADQCCPASGTVGNDADCCEENGTPSGFNRDGCCSEAGGADVDNDRDCCDEPGAGSGSAC